MMTPQETQLLQEFLDQLTAVRGIAKDPDADALIARAVSQQPDASYLLVQRALLLDQALQSAKAQLAELQDQVRRSSPAASSSSFLGSLGAAWGRHPAAEGAGPTGAAQAPVMSPTAINSPPGANPLPPQRPGFLGGGGGGFLQQAAATAAGVAGGAFLFSGIQNMMGHHEGSLLGGGHPTGAATEGATSNHADGKDAAKEEHLAAENSSANDSTNDLSLDDVSADDSFSSDDFA
ncbi:MAG: DUF2076 domain-containing protein [Betaproteobacteria bacterium]